MSSSCLFAFLDKGNSLVELEKAGEEFPALIEKSIPSGSPMGKPLSEHRIKNLKRTPPKEYAEGGATEGKDYADRKNYKYPIDNEKHVRAAISYFNKPKNYRMYSPSERASMMSRIRRAAKRFGISMSPEGKQLEKSLVMKEAWSLVKSVEAESEVALKKSEDLLDDAEKLLKGMLKRLDKK